MWGKSWLGRKGAGEMGLLARWPQTGQVLCPALGGGVFLLVLLNLGHLARRFGRSWWTLWCHTTALV